MEDGRIRATPGRPNALALIYNRFGRFDKAVAEATEALRRSPGTAFPMSNLAFAYRGLGRYADARKVGDEAVKLEVATAPTRRLLYQLGIMMNDGSAAAQLEWAKSRPREFDLIVGAGAGGRRSKAGCATRRRSTRRRPTWRRRAASAARRPASGRTLR